MSGFGRRLQQATQPNTPKVRLYLSPASGSFANGNTFNAQIREDSLGTLINAVQANLTYPSGLLQVNSVTVNTAVFDQTLQPYSGTTPGVIQLGVGILSNPTVSGDQLVATISFTVLSAGSATVAYDTGSLILRASDSANILQAEISAHYTLS